MSEPGGVRLPPVAGAGMRVPVLGGERRYVALDNAASTPPFEAVLAAVGRAAEWYGSVHRGAGFKSHRSTDAYESARYAVHRFLRADPERNTVVFTRNTTDAINHLAASMPLPPGAVVLVSGMEHHSNDLPWRKVARVVHVAAHADGRLDEQDLRAQLRRHRETVAVLAVTGASNVTGIVNPVHRWARWAHEAGARIVVDAAQLAPHRPIDVRADADPEHLDVVAFSAHKMYAPFGCGALMAPASLFRSEEPYQVGGGTVDTVGLDYATWAALPDREEAGTPNVLGAIALAAAMEVYAEVGWDAIQDHERRRTARLLAGLAGVPGLTIYGDADPAGAAERLGVVAFNLHGTPHALVAGILADEWGIGTRSGCFCAHPYLKRLLDLSLADAAKAERRILAGDRSGAPGAVRASLGLQTSDDDVDRLVEALGAIAAGQHRSGYRMDCPSGMWHHPDLATRPVPESRVQAA